MKVLNQSCSETKKITISRKASSTGHCSALNGTLMLDTEERRQQDAGADVAHGRCTAKQGAGDQEPCQRGGRGENQDDKSLLRVKIESNVSDLFIIYILSNIHEDRNGNISTSRTGAGPFHCTYTPVQYTWRREYTAARRSQEDSHTQRRRASQK
jgi:hypothetical protein